MYRKVRLACAEGMSQREAARHFNISRDTVAKMMAFSVPPGYRRKAAVKRPKLDAFAGIIDGWLEGDREVHRKQHHTAKRVFERLRDEHGFTGGYTIVKDYMRERERRGREMFVPLTHPPGHAQADFGEAVVIIGGVEQKAHFFVMDLPHSDACYVRAYPAARPLSRPLHAGNCPTGRSPVPRRASVIAPMAADDSLGLASQRR
jgi:transposase